MTSSINAQMPPEVDQFVETAMRNLEVPGLSVTIVKDGKLLVAKGYGVRELGKPETVDADTMFDIASLAKSFTAAAIATLVDEGKMRWDDPVRKHLPAFELSDDYRSQNITIRDLLTHRHGLERGDFMWRFTNYDTAEVLRRMRYLEMREPFRATFAYSNVGYAVAGEAAATAAGMSWSDLVRTRLLEPLGMTGTTAGVEHAATANHASGHARLAGVHQPIRARKEMNTLPAGGVNATARDISRWLLFHLGDGTWNGKRVISAAAMAEMHSPQNIIPTTPEMPKARGVNFFRSYGLGWQVMDFRGHPMLWHSGGADGMPTYMAILPNDNLGVAVFVNTWDAPYVHGAIATQVFDTLLKTGVTNPPPTRPATPPAPKPARVEGTSPSLPLDKYAGTYENKLHGAMVIRSEDGKLVLQFGGGELADLTHWHYDTFRVTWRDRAYEWWDSFLTFSLDEKGAPRKFEMPLPPRDVIVATR